MSTSRNPRHRKPGSAAAVKTIAVRAAAIGAVAMPGAAAIGAHQHAQTANVADPITALSRPLQEMAEPDESAASALEQSHLDRPIHTPYQVSATDVTSTKPVPATYTVREGDSLSRIAERTLGGASRYREIFALNKDREQADGERLTDASLIQPGWKLELPSGAKTEHVDATSAAYSTPSHHASKTSHTASTKKSSKSSTSSSASSASSTKTGSSHTHSFTVSPASSASGSLKDWINEAVTILKASGYDVSYDAVYETAIHESGGNPDAVNETDSNAVEGHPSIGLMQTIQSTFDAYALPGHTNIYNPVDNIIAAARYAAAVYGGLDEMVEARCDGSCWRGY